MANIKQFKKGSDTRLTKNFHLSEMDCRCKYPECQWTYVDMDHMALLQKKREKWGKPVKIHSGFRCERYNRVVGGSTGSIHLKGSATDITVKDLTPEAVHADCEEFNGLGKYSTFTHVDSRSVGYPARWDFSKKK